MNPLSQNNRVMRLATSALCSSLFIIACSTVEEAPKGSEPSRDGGQDGDASIDSPGGGHTGGSGSAGSSGKSGAGGSSDAGGAAGTGGDAGLGGKAGISGGGGYPDADTDGAAGTAGNAGDAGSVGTGGQSGSGGSVGFGGSGGSGGEGGSAGSGSEGGSTGSAGEGSGGSAAASGHSGSGGFAGTGGEAGSAGSSGSSGSAGMGTGGVAGEGGTGGSAGAGSALLYDGRFINYSPISADQAVIFGHKHAFLHQSTGQYILDAIPAVAGFATPDTSRIRSIQGAPQDIGNGINELWLSTSDIQQKIDEYAAFVNTGSNGTYYETFLFKLCFLDQWQTANPAQSAQEILAHYKQTIAVLQAKYPGRKYVHMTWPLYDEVAWTEPYNVLYGKYNALLRAEYGGKEPIFDLADIEATRPDGTKCTFVESGTSNSWPVFCPGEADPDHGHPAPAVSARLARVFLYMLYDLYK